MKLSKWSYELIIVVVLFIVGFGVWYFLATKDERAQNAETAKMINIAQRQALEIAIIEQSSKLADYKNQMAQNQREITRAKQAQEQKVLQEKGFVVPQAELLPIVPEVV